MALGSESIAASAIADPIEKPARNPLEDPPPSQPLMSIWDNKEHIVKIEISGVKSWKCNWCNRPPTAHWNAAKALAHVSKLYTTAKHVSVCKAIIPPGYLSWYHNLAVQKAKQRSRSATTENKIEDEITSTREMVTEARSAKRRTTGDGNRHSPDTASHSSHGHQATL